MPEAPSLKIPKIFGQKALFFVRKLALLNPELKLQREDDYLLLIVERLKLQFNPPPTDRKGYRLWHRYLRMLNVGNLNVVFESTRARYPFRVLSLCYRNSKFPLPDFYFVFFLNTAIHDPPNLFRSSWVGFL